MRTGTLTSPKVTFPVQSARGAIATNRGMGRRRRRRRSRCSSCRCRTSGTAADAWSNRRRSSRRTACTSRCPRSRRCLLVRDLPCVLLSTTEKLSKMARAPLEEPEGFLYKPELLTVEEERNVLDVVETLRFDPIVMHGVEARRTARHFGLDYDYKARTPQEGEP